MNKNSGSIQESRFCGLFSYNRRIHPKVAEALKPIIDIDALVLPPDYGVDPSLFYGQVSFSIPNHQDPQIIDIFEKNGIKHHADGQPPYEGYFYDPNLSKRKRLGHFADRILTRILMFENKASIDTIVRQIFQLGLDPLQYNKAIQQAYYAQLKKLQQN